MRPRLRGMPRGRATRAPVAAGPAPDAPTPPGIACGDAPCAARPAAMAQSAGALPGPRARGAEVDTAVAAVIAAFCDYLAAERGLAPLTVAAYRRDLEDVSRFLQARGLALPHGLTADSVRDYLLGLRAAGAADATVARRLAALRAFERYCHEGGGPPARAEAVADALAGFPRPRGAAACRACCCRGWRPGCWSRRGATRRSPCVTAPPWSSFTAVACACPSSPACDWRIWT